MKTLLHNGASHILLFLMVAIFSVSIPVPLAYADEALNMGIFPRRNANVTQKLFFPMAKYLSRKLGREVNLLVSRDFDTFWEGVEKGRYDIVHYNQYHYLKSHKDAGYQVIAMNEEFGSAELSGAIFVRRDSGIKDLGELRGKKVVFGGNRLAFIAYIVNTQLLRRAGLADGDYEEAFAVNPPNAIMAVFYKQAVAGGAGDIGIRLPVVSQNINTDELVILAQSEPFAHIPWAVKDSMPVTLRNQIRSLLVELKETEEGMAVLKAAKLNGISAAMDSDYHPHRAVVQEVLGENY